jgi:futalosine hydrolase
MHGIGGILLVAATERELCGRPGLVCGIGPVEAAAATARSLALGSPSAVVHVGVAGGRHLSTGTVVIGTEAVYADLAAAIPVVSTVRPAPTMLAAARAALPGAETLPIGTSAAVGGQAHALAVEAMEGFGVLRACALAGVPALEVRVVSNEIGEPDRSRWDVPGALDALDRTLTPLLQGIASLG